MKRILLLIFAVLGTCSYAHPQLIEYGPKPEAKDRLKVVKQHVAIELMTGDYDDVKSEFLLEALDHPDKAQEPMSAMIFSQAEQKKIFYAVGTEDISTFKAIYNLPDKSAKLDIYRSLTWAQKARVWQINFAQELAKGLDRPQQLSLIQISKAVKKGDVKEIVSLLEKSAPLFTNQAQGRALFMTIGTADCGSKTASKKPVMGSCDCSKSHTNFSCSGSCNGGSGCSETDDGCSWLWLFKCDGGCSGGYEIIQ